MTRACSGTRHPIPSALWPKDRQVKWKWEQVGTAEEEEATAVVEEEAVAAVEEVGTAAALGTSFTF
ncbi:unnamed protein product [Leuciscus chuanchicus]